MAFGRVSLTATANTSKMELPPKIEKFVTENPGKQFKNIIVEVGLKIVNNQSPQVYYFNLKTSHPQQILITKISHGVPGKPATSDSVTTYAFNAECSDNRPMVPVNSLRKLVGIITGDAHKYKGTGVQKSNYEEIDGGIKYEFSTVYIKPAKNNEDINLKLLQAFPKQDFIDNIKLYVTFMSTISNFKCEWNENVHEMLETLAIEDGNVPNNDNNNNVLG